MVFRTKPEIRISRCPEIRISRHPDFQLVAQKENKQLRKSALFFRHLGLSGLYAGCISSPGSCESTADSYGSGENSEHPEARISGNPQIRISDFPNIRISGNPEFQISGIPEIRKSSIFQISGSIVTASRHGIYRVFGPIVPKSAFRVFLSGSKRCATKSYADSWRYHLQKCLLWPFRGPLRF